MTPLYDIIAGQPFFRGLSQEHLCTLAANAMQMWFESGELIFDDGDVANRFYLIIEGKVALESSVKHRGTVVLQTLGSGELLGWSWLFSSYVWRLRARATEPTEAIFFYGTRWREQCELNHDLGYELFNRISELMMQRVQIARRRFLDHLAQCRPGSDAKASARKAAVLP